MSDFGGCFHVERALCTDVESLLKLYKIWSLALSSAKKCLYLQKYLRIGTEQAIFPSFNRIGMAKFSKYLGPQTSLRLNMIVLCVMAFLLLVSLSVMFSFSHRVLKKEAMNGAWQTLDVTVLQIDNILQTVEETTENVYEDLRQHLDQPERMYTYSRRIVECNPNIDGCAIVFRPGYYPGHDLYMAYVHRDVNGEFVTQETFANRPYTEQVWYSETVAKEIACWTAPLKNENAEDEPLITFCQPIFNSKDECVGAVAVDVSINELSQIVLAAKPSPNSYCTLVDKNGSFIVHPDKEKLAHQTVFTQTETGADPSVLVAAKALLSGETGYKPFHLNSEDWLVFYKPFTRSEVSGRSVQNLDWSIGLIYSEDDIFDSYNHLLLLVMACALIGLLAFFVFCRLFIRRELKDLNQLTQSAQRIAKGHYNELIPDAQRDDEIGQLQDNFVKMQHSLAAQFSEQKQLSSSLEKRGEYLRQASGHSLETDRLKTAFLYYVTNQMTAPSVIIDNSVTTLCNNYYDISQKDAEQEVEKIKAQSKQIVSLLDELVHITEIENGKEVSHE